MQLRARLGAWLSAAIIASVLFGCTVVDQYSGRAIVYNLEAEQAQDQGLLLNIVRAYLRRPMQFTTVSTITGIASASGSVQYTLPTNLPFRPATQGATGIAAFPPLPTWLFGGSMSGGPAFTVPVLDTQEFYQGILRAIPGQLWDLYLQANYPPDLLFNLLVEKVVMKRVDNGCPSNDHLAGCEFIFINSIESDIQLDLFQALADYLLALGLTTEQPEPPTVPFVRPQSINVRYVGNPSPNNHDEAQVIGPPSGSAPSEAQPPARPYKLCFAPRGDQGNACVHSLCGATPKPRTRPEQPRTRPEPARISEPIRTCPKPREAFTFAGLPDAQIKSSGAASVNLVASFEFIRRLRTVADGEGLPQVAEELRPFAGKPIVITIYMRHTEGMIYYLGTVVRRVLNPDFGLDKRLAFAKSDPPYRLHREEKCVVSMSDCGYIFKLQEGLMPSPGEFLSVNYEGQWYSIPRSSRPENDFSSLTFDILKQLVALNSSAKALPQSSVITAVGGP